MTFVIGLMGGFLLGWLLCILLTCGREKELRARLESIYRELRQEDDRSRQSLNRELFILERFGGNHDEMD
jgi:hypothetical protein